MVASTQDVVAIVMGAADTDVVIVAMAAPHMQTTWLPKAAGFRVLAGDLFRTSVGHSTPRNK
jgi:hypothetical protein